MLEAFYNTSVWARDRWLISALLVYEACSEKDPLVWTCYHLF